MELWDFISQYEIDQAKGLVHDDDGNLINGSTDNNSDACNIPLDNSFNCTTSAAVSARALVTDDCDATLFDNDITNNLFDHTTSAAVSTRVLVIGNTTLFNNNITDITIPLKLDQPIAKPILAASNALIMAGTFLVEAAKEMMDCL